MSDKVFRDPLYNYISFDRDRDEWLLKLLDCREVQRLRRIHQLGVSNFTYPGADHTRLAHSLGVTHLMKLVLEHLERTNAAEKIKGARQALLATALLHDVGHGPFSHLFEPCLGINHEQWSIAVISDESTQVHQVLRDEAPHLPNHVADLIDSNNQKYPAWQRALMSSQLDVDRLDYLRRDSLFTGAGYGHFDWHRLLTTIEFYDGETDLVWPEKAALAIEEYIFARYYMYQNVYLHKTTRGYEQLLQAMWKRANQLRSDGTNIQANPVLERFWKYQKPEPGSMPVADYLAVEEFTVLDQIQQWVGHGDKSLSDCARRFLERNGLGVCPRIKTDLDFPQGMRYRVTWLWGVFPVAVVRSGMSKTFRKWAPDQMWLLPPSPRDWLEDGHLVYFLLDVVGEMDLAPFFERYRNSVSG
ncbi:HD domain-containing protein, partial [bacterium]|nr:HD domain-containing protein [bacterium]